MHVVETDDPGGPNGQSRQGAVLRELRIGHGLSQEALAKTAGLSVRTVRGIETNRTRPRPGTVRLLAEALDLAEPQRRILIAALTSTVDPTGSAPDSRNAFEPPAPQQLPAPPQMFAGRADELARLDAMLDSPRSPAVCVLSGPGGIGKTWLALRWAHRELARFPDGQVYVNLRGFDPLEKPMSELAALRELLTALGVDTSSCPSDAQSQAGLFRTLASRRRILFILDNARDAAQVASLLPGGAGCTTLITSRMDLAALTTTHAARRLKLGALSQAESHHALAARVGKERLTAEPEAAADIVRHCAGLPLALGIFAARLAVHPEFPLGTLVAELRNEATRLDLLDAGDLSADLRATFDSSRRALDDETARVFALLGVAPGSDIGVHAVASLAGARFVDARSLLHRLEQANLVEQHRPGRYRMHDLTHLYAKDLAQRTLPAKTRDTAGRRLVDFYLHTAYTGARVLLAESRVTVELTEASDGCAPLTLDGSTTVAWFDAEYSNLLAVLRSAEEHRLDAQTWRLAWAVGAYQWLRGLSVDSRACWITGLAAAQRTSDAAAQAKMHRYVGDSYARTGHLAEAARHLDEALTIAESTANATEQYLTRTTYASLRHQHDDNDAALRHTEQALTLAVDLGNARWQAWSLNAKGWYSAHLGRHADGRELCRQALELSGRLGDSFGMADTEDSLGYISRQQGEHFESVVHYRHAINLFRKLGNTYAEANSQEALGDVRDELGQHARARGDWRRALEHCRRQHRTADARRLEEKIAASDAQSSALRTPGPNRSD
ncbi:MAG: ATP-binding protein [Stackebrandtia sp.]